MAGVNLVKRLKERKTGVGPGAGSRGKLFGMDMPTFSGGSSIEISSGDRIRILLMVASIGAGFFMRSFVRDFTSRKEAALRVEVNKLDQQIAEEKKKLDALKGLAQEADAYERQMAELQRKLAIIESLGKNRNLAVRMVDFIVSEMPSNIWLAKMNLDTRTEQKVEVLGNATSLQLVSEFMRRLEGAVFFPRWQLVETSSRDASTASDPKANKGPSDVRSFSLNAKVVPL
ncbi:MAG: PilN domain-containing protein [Bdellovibrionales bacterium]|nr:PilN domain-containing protein [Bdellovibrionales bacterium]